MRCGIFFKHPVGFTGRILQGNYNPLILQSDVVARALHESAFVDISCCSRTLIIIEERTVNWDRVEGNWKQFKGKVKENWGKITDDEFDKIGGRRDQLAGKIQESYGVSRDEAEKQVKDWESRN